MAKQQSPTDLTDDKDAGDAPAASPMDKFKALAKRLLVVSSDDLREARDREAGVKSSQAKPTK